MRERREVIEDMKKLFEYSCGHDRCAVGKLNELLGELEELQIGMFENFKKEHPEKFKE